jgi:uncharacterized membrane protein YkoI
MQKMHPYMKASLAVAVVVLLAAKQSQAQTTSSSGGEVSARAETSRLTTRIPGVDDAQRARVRVSGDSAQRIAMDDLQWRGRVTSVEVDEEDARLYWDVKIVPDNAPQTIVRYRVDAGTGAILGIREFAGVRGLVRIPIRKP